MNSESMIAQLQALPADRLVQILPDRTRARMQCPFHLLSDGSREKTPSFFINLVDLAPYRQGSGHCFGCGRNVRDFHVILDPSQEGRTKEISDDDGDLFLQPIHTPHLHDLLFGSDAPVYDLRAAMPWSPAESWRTISGPLMQAVGAKMIFEPDFKILMAYLPCLINGEHVGGVRARLEKRDGAPSYYNVKGGWTAQQGLFPYDYVKRLIKRRNLKTVVPVEGPRDALRGLMFGIPTLAILGSQNWSENKAELLFNLGIKRVITAFDPDEAGLRATQKVYASFNGELQVQRFNFETQVAAFQSKTGIALTESVDPGNMPPWIAKNLRAAAYREI